MASRGESPLYVYAIADSGIPRRLSVRGRALRGLPAGRVAAIVEPRADRPPATADALREQHALVQALADRCGDLLPVRFGSLLGEVALREVLERRGPEISAALDLVRGRRQMTLRAYGQSSDEARTGPSRTGTEFLESRRRTTALPPAAAVIRKQLADLIAAERIERGEGPLLFSAYHLVPVERLELYRERASNLQSMFSPDRMKVTGPFPPFAFAPVLF